MGNPQRIVTAPAEPAQQTEEPKTETRLHAAGAGARVWAAADLIFDGYEVPKGTRGRVRTTLVTVDWLTDPPRSSEVPLRELDVELLDEGDWTCAMAEIGHAAEQLREQLDAGAEIDRAPLATFCTAVREYVRGEAHYVAVVHVLAQAARAFARAADAETSLDKEASGREDEGIWARMRRAMTEHRQARKALQRAALVFAKEGGVR